MNAKEAPQTVELTIDGRQVTVPAGINVIEAAKLAGIHIPHYCYHPYLSVPGNCRMCQVQIKGQPKLTIGCNTEVKQGMEVLTQLSSPEVRAAQAAVLEFMLINHPLDCTVCDQAGHCKLQDYNYQYNPGRSRFLEDKVHKAKAKPLGPTVMLDAERCIMCTRCVRFCDQITKTGELGMFNRGDRSEIGVFEGRPLDNPLSGTVVDLCPVGALTHKKWRFNSRIWFTRETGSICPGCSTGCNVKAAVRDNAVVLVKARMNHAVNREWLCDEGRYGFDRFLPAKRLSAPMVKGRHQDWEAALKKALPITSGKTLVLAAADLLLEEYDLLQRYLKAQVAQHDVALAYRERELTPLEAILISPDYAPNKRGAIFSGLVSGDLTAGYTAALERLLAGQYQNALFIGDRSVLRNDLTPDVIAAVKKLDTSVALLCDAGNELKGACKILLPGRSILEKSGLMINGTGRLQYAQRLVEPPGGTEPDWAIINRLAEAGGRVLTDAVTDRDKTAAYLSGESRLPGVSLADVKAGGVAI